MQMRIDEAGQDGVTVTVQQLGMSVKQEAGGRPPCRALRSGPRRWQRLRRSGAVRILAEDRPSVHHQVGWRSGQRHGPCQQKGRRNASPF